MHIIIAIAVLLALAYVLAQAQRNKEAAELDGGSASQAGLEAAGSGVAVAFIANGKLFYQRGAGIEELNSPYVQEMQDKQEKSRERHAWKQGTSFGIAAGGHMRQFDGDSNPTIATSAQFGSNENLLYFLKDRVIGGLFSYDFASGVEQRLLHRQNLDLSDLYLERAGGRILCSSSNKTGVAHIAMLNGDGSQYCELTGGDTLDTAPAWIPGADRQVLYQSTGIARHQSGHIVAYGNASIQMLDMETSKVTPVLEDPKFDYLHPRVGPQGNLYFIRRPYELPSYKVDNAVLDTLLFPFRLLRALFHFLNFFSLMYSRKPLTSASGPVVNADLKDIIVKGKRIDAEKAMRSGVRIGGIPSLVPSSWQLVQRDRQGNETVLARSVAAYDILADGEIVYSNGRGVFLLAESGQQKLILKTDLVGEIAGQGGAAIAAEVPRW